MCVGMRIIFSKQYRYVTNYLHLYVSNYCIFSVYFASYSLQCVICANASIS